MEVGEETKIMDIMVNDVKKQFSFILSNKFPEELAAKIRKSIEEVKAMKLEDQLREVINLRREQLKTAEPYIKYDVNDEIAGQENNDIVLVDTDRIIGGGHMSINKWGDIDPKKLGSLIFFAIEIINGIKQGTNDISAALNKIFNIEYDKGKSIKLGKYEGVDKIYFIEDGNHRVLFATIFGLKYVPARVNDFKLNYEHSFKSAADDKLTYNHYPTSSKKTAAVKEFAESRDK